MSFRDLARAEFARLPVGVRRLVLHRLGRYAPWEVGFDFTPPALGPGEEIGPPDFVGIGVQKAGTTWWYELILGHAEVSSHPGIHKERHFFDRFGAQSMQAGDVSQYHGWFPRRTGTLTGEWTPDYFAYPWVPRLLKQAAPDTRLVLLIRDPVERFRSGLAHHRREGKPLDGAAIADAVQRGFYARALTGWLEEFDADQLLVLQYERCVADPETQLETTFRHLGLASSRHQAGEQSAPSPASTGPDLDDQVREQLINLYASDVAALAERLGDLDLALWPNFAHLAAEGSASDPGSNSPTRRP
jgi:Sulfotransferase family